MILKNQASHPGTCLPLKEKRRSEPADSATDNDAIIGLPGIDHVLRKRIVNSIADRMPGLQNSQRVSVGRAVFAYAAVAGELVLFLAREKFRRRGRPE
jgi:hypothetical protein